jgi:hypothetical protein
MIVTITLQTSLFKVQVWWYLSASHIWFNLCKITNPCTLDVHINTTIEIDDAQPCYAHVIGPWLLPLFKLKEYDFIAKYFINELLILNSLVIFKLLGVFIWI